VQQWYYYVAALPSFTLNTGFGCINKHFTKNKQRFFILHLRCRYTAAIWRRVGGVVSIELLKCFVVFSVANFFSNYSKAFQLTKTLQ
jgi:hypothetical protein